MARTRMKGKGIVFTYEGTEYQCDLTSVVLEKGSADTAATDGTLTFCDVGTSAADGDVWKMNITALQSTDYTPEKALHALIWDLAKVGGEMAFVFAPHGNADASQNQPHFTGSVLVKEGSYPSVGGDAGEDAWTFDYEFEVKDDLVNRVGDGDTPFVAPTTTKASK
jgi:hypothetical protein